jgi:hypothetical protein
MQLNVFEWIREGVKRSVILGVQDAVDAIGTPAHDDIRTRLAALTQPADGGLSEPALSGAAKRKRLGRSLREFDGGEE